MPTPTRRRRPRDRHQDQAAQEEGAERLELGEDTASLRSLGQLLEGVQATRHEPPEVAAVKGSLRMQRVLGRAARGPVPDSPDRLRVLYRGELLVLERPALDELRRTVLNLGVRRNAARAKAASLAAASAASASAALRQAAASLFAFARRAFSNSAIAEPNSAGDFTVRTPASSSARNLSAAVPLPPATIAPAWPMRLPGGAVTPAM